MNLEPDLRKLLSIYDISPIKQKCGAIHGFEYLLAIKRFELIPFGKDRYSMTISCRIEKRFVNGDIFLDEIFVLLDSPPKASEKAICRSYRI